MSRNSTARSAPSGNEATPRPRRILLVDDDHEFRETIAEVLQDEGWDVATAKDGEEALSLAQHLVEDFVLLVDYRMPGLNGGEVFEHVRARLDSRLGGVLMTASSDVQRLAQRHGFSHHVGKPFSLDVLFETLEKARGDTD